MEQEENRQTYLEKMERQIREWEENFAELESVARQRNAVENDAVKTELEDLRGKLNEARAELEKLKSGGAADWPEASRSVSESYKEMKETAEDASHKIKRK